MSTMARPVEKVWGGASTGRGRGVCRLRAATAKASTKAANNPHKRMTPSPEEGFRLERMGEVAKSHPPFRSSPGTRGTSPVQLDDGVSGLLIVDKFQAGVTQNTGSPRSRG